MFTSFDGQSVTVRKACGAENATCRFLNTSWIENSYNEVTTSGAKCLHYEPCRVASRVSDWLQPCTDQHECNINQTSDLNITAHKIQSI